MLGVINHGIEEEEEGSTMMENNIPSMVGRDLGDENDHPSSDTPSDPIMDYPSEYHVPVMEIRSNLALDTEVRIGKCRFCGGSIWLNMTTKVEQCEGCYRIYGGKDE